MLNIPKRIRIDDSAIDMYHFERKSTLELAKSRSMVSEFRIFISRRMSKIARVTTMAVKKLVIRPMDNVTAKPLMGPEPNWNKISAAIKVVKLESKMAEKAC